MWSVSIFYCRLSFCILDSFLKCSAFELVKSNFTFSYLYPCHCIPETITQDNIQEPFFPYIFLFLWVLRCQVFNQLQMDFGFQCSSSEYQYLLFLASSIEDSPFPCIFLELLSWRVQIPCVFVSGIFIMFHSSTYSNSGTTQIWLLQLCSVEWNQEVWYLQFCSSNTILIGPIRQVCACALY